MIERVLEFAGTLARRSPAAAGRSLDVARLVEDIAGRRSRPPCASGASGWRRTWRPRCPASAATRSSLRRAIDNLVENAIKYGERGRWLAVRAAADEAGRAVRLTVEDRGSGIAPADLPRLFEPFFRGRDARGRGFGLGLSLVHRVVDDHGGRLAVRSEPGLGTTFTIDLPAAPPRVDAPRGDGGMPSRILVVEDEPGLRLAISDRLRAEGYDVATAADGDEGLRCASEQHFDLVVLDVMMPGRERLRRRAASCGSAASAPRC